MSDGALGTLDRIRVRESVMPSAMARIAAYVTTQPTSVLDLSTIDLADQAGVSPATISRFCRRLGYPGYTQFRLALAADLAGDATDALESWREFDPRDAPTQVLERLLQVSVLSLRATASLIDIDLAQDISDRLWQAAQVDIYGVGGSAFIASNLHVRLYTAGLNAQVWGEVHAGLASAALLDERCVAIGISASGSTQETVDIMRQAKQSGAYTVAITGPAQSPLAQLSDAHLPSEDAIPHREPSTFGVSHSQSLVADLLYLLVARHDDAAILTRRNAAAAAVSSRRHPAERPIHHRPTPARAGVR